MLSKITVGNEWGDVDDGHVSFGTSQLVLVLILVLVMVLLILALSVLIFQVSLPDTGTRLGSVGRCFPHFQVSFYANPLFL